MDMFEQVRQTKAGSLLDRYGWLLTADNSQIARKRHQKLKKFIDDFGALGEVDLVENKNQKAPTGALKYQAYMLIGQRASDRAFLWACIKRRQ